MGKSNSGQCKAKVKVLHGRVIGALNDHTHAPVVGRPDMGGEMSRGGIALLTFKDEVCPSNDTLNRDLDYEYD